MEGRRGEGRGPEMPSGGNTTQNNAERLFGISPGVSSPSQVPPKGPGEQIQFSVVTLQTGRLSPRHPEWKPALHGSH